MRLEASVQKIEQGQEAYKNVISSLSRQVQLQQQYVEEMTRTEGDSGLKQIRTNRFGTRPYFSSSFSGRSIASIHDHSNNIRTCGMGEFAAVLNGVEFRTRHNDYRLNMPSTSSKEYGAYEPIPFPDVPAAVLNQPTIDDQITEMREWFAAWKNQDYSKRDYRKFFKPVLCYMEGMWTLTDDNGAIDEPFFSDRHAIDADSWFDLQEKLRFTSNTGRKSTKENFAFLPTTITSLDVNGMPMYAQYNYKILCHPLKRDVPLTRFKLQDDLGIRLMNGKSMEGLASSRAARFQVYPDKKFSGTFKQEHSTKGETFLDQLMREIPGKDNYQGNIKDDAFGSTVFDLDAQFPGNKKMDASNEPPAMNAAYYHRNYKTSGKDAMGLSSRTRGFADTNLYVALNSRSKVAVDKVKTCKKQRCPKPMLRAGKCTRKLCTEWIQRVSHAIPMEIIYLTPLSKWNPYDLPYLNQTEEAYDSNTVNGQRRNGGKTNTTAYAGTASKLYYRTPADFFSGAKRADRDPADTVRGSVGVLDKNGDVQIVTASGVRTHIPNIPGVGVMRQRYPIMPIHQAGNFIYKEVEAVKDILMEASQYRKFYPSGTPFSFGAANGTDFDELYMFELSSATVTPPGDHTHTLELSTSDIRDLRADKVVTVTSTENSGHTHELDLMLSTGMRKGKPFEKVLIKKCDGQSRRCWDGHKGSLSCVDCVIGSDLLPGTM